MGEENCIKGFVRKQEGKGPPGRTRCRWEFYVKMDTKEIGMDLIYLAQD
jgi:hypothetical protein